MVSDARLLLRADYRILKKGESCAASNQLSGGGRTIGVKQQRGAPSSLESRSAERERTIGSDERTMKHTQ